MKMKSLTLMFLTIAMSQAWSLAQAQTVKITPLGQRTGEFCAGDRALLFEDPTGVRILYDPGNTVAGGTDARLRDVHVILISHAHVDHVGSARLNQNPDLPSSSCAGAATVATPNTNTAEIAAAKNAAVFTQILEVFLNRKISAIQGGTVVPTCATQGLTNETIVPGTSSCTARLGIGGKRTVRMVSARQGVQISGVLAVHPDDVSNTFLSEPERTNLAADSLSAYGGIAMGFVVSFTNGLKVYLSGDTGMTSDMKTIVNAYYQPNLAVLNIGDTSGLGPDEGAFAVTDLIRPTAVIPSHANEVATSSGIVQPGTRTARFIELVSPGLSVVEPLDLIRGRRKVSIFVPLSGITMEFDGAARCLTGCQGLQPR